MKKTVFFFAALLCLQVTASAQIATVTKNLTGKNYGGIQELKMLNEKAYNAFVKTYGEIDDVTAYVEKENTFVSCTKKNVKYRILYNNKGRHVYTVKYYAPELIPSEAADLVKEEFFRYSILRASEINMSGRTTYLIDIRYKNKFKTIRISEGRFDVQQEYNYQD